VADKHIDYQEVIEYGRYFDAASARLVNLSALVDIEALRRRVRLEVAAVEAELTRACTHQSDLRTGRGGTATAVAEVRSVIRRFHHYLGTLPGTIRLDREAFFRAGKRGKLDRLKPADLLARAGDVLRGFEVAANAALPGAAEWRAAIATAHDALAAWLDGKQDSRSDEARAVTALSAARERFLHVYNGMAKRLVYVVLADVGRLDEYRRYFLDMQVHEGRSQRAEPPGDEPGDAHAGAPADEPGDAHAAHAD
jgi:hypothetical protein